MLAIYILYLFHCTFNLPLCPAAYPKPSSMNY